MLLTSAGRIACSDLRVAGVEEMPKLLDMTSVSPGEAHGCVWARFPAGSGSGADAVAMFGLGI